MKVKVFPGRREEKILEDMVNNWLKKNQNLEVVDIKYGYGVDPGWRVGWHSAMVIYRE